MGRITNGTVEYGETRKIADYESKKMTVTLSFNVDEDEDYQTVLDEVAAKCMAKCHEKLGIVTASAPSKAPAKPEKEEAAINLNLQDPPAKPKGKLGRPPGKAKKPEPAPEEVVDEEPEEEDDLANLMGDDAPDETITDQALGKAIVDRLSKAKQDEALKKRTTTAIRKLISKYAGAGKMVAEIPVIKRADFIKAIADLETEEMADA